jgi:hypothetical protein
MHAAPAAVLPAGAAHGPGATRTRDLLLRRQSLYPPELRARRGLTCCGSSVSFHSSRLLSGSDSPIRVRIGYNRRPSLSSPATLAIRVPSECTLELCPRSTASARNSAPGVRHGVMIPPRASRLRDPGTPDHLIRGAGAGHRKPVLHAPLRRPSPDPPLSSHRLRAARRVATSAVRACISAIMRSLDSFRAAAAAVRCVMAMIFALS